MYEDTLNNKWRQISPFFSLSSAVWTNRLTEHTTQSRSTSTNNHSLHSQKLSPNTTLEWTKMSDDEQKEVMWPHCCHVSALLCFYRQSACFLIGFRSTPCDNSQSTRSAPFPPNIERLKSVYCCSIFKTLSHILSASSDRSCDRYF